MDRAGRVRLVWGGQNLWDRATGANVGERGSGLAGGFQCQGGESG